MHAVVEVVVSFVVEAVLAAKQWGGHLARGVYYYSLMALVACYIPLVQLQRRAVTTTVHAYRALRRRVCRRRKSGPATVAVAVKPGAGASAGVGPVLAPSRDDDDSTPPPGSGSSGHGAGWQLPVAERRELVVRDGVRLQYSVINPGRRRVMVFANGLGCDSSFTAYSPLLHRYGAGCSLSEWTFLTWDYRGLFGSDAPKSVRRLSVPNHAEDLHEILNAERGHHNGPASVVDVLVGFSMGVQVSLEFSVLYPERVRQLVLLNGTHGHIFDSAFQPFFRVPLLPAVLHAFISSLQKRPYLLANACALVRRFQRYPSRLYNFLFGSPMMRRLRGEQYLADFMEQYFGDVTTSPAHTLNYLRLFEELNAHSVYHLLPHIATPTLVVSGLLDILTPAYQSFEIARRMPHAHHVVCPTASHVALLESPDRVLYAIVKHIERLTAHRISLSEPARPLALPIVGAGMGANAVVSPSSSLSSSSAGSVSPGLSPSRASAFGVVRRSGAGAAAASVDVKQSPPSQSPHRRGSSGRAAARVPLLRLHAAGATATVALPASGSSASLAGAGSARGIGGGGLSTSPSDSSLSSNELNDERWRLPLITSGGQQQTHPAPAELSGAGPALHDLPSDADVDVDDATADADADATGAATDTDGDGDGSAAAEVAAVAAAASASVDASTTAKSTSSSSQQRRRVVALSRCDSPPVPEAAALT